MGKKLQKNSYQKLFNQSRSLNDLLMKKLLDNSTNLDNERKDQISQLLSTIEKKNLSSDTKKTSSTKKTLKEKLQSRLGK